LRLIERAVFYLRAGDRLSYKNPGKYTTPGKHIIAHFCINIIADFDVCRYPLPLWEASTLPKS
jgi:hypothetical protein